MAPLRHTARSTLGDLFPESLHDKLLDAGFFDHEQPSGGEPGSRPDSPLSMV